MRLAVAPAFALLFAFLLAGCGGQYFERTDEAAPEVRYSLATLPHKEIWTGVVFNGNKVGFSRLKIEALPEPGRFRIDTESSIRLRLLGFDKSVVLRSSDVVGDDLSLVSFHYDHLIDGSTLKIDGSVSGNELRATVEAGSSRTDQRLPLKAKVYPAVALALYPALAGLRIGAEYGLSVYNGEVQKLADAVQRVEAWERSKLFDGPAFKITTEMLGLASTTWMDSEARPVLELGLNGIIVSALEDERIARSYLAAAAVNQDDVLVEWSLVKPAAPIANARELKRLRFFLSGPATKQPISDARQHCVPADKQWVCQIDAEAGDRVEVTARYLGSSLTIQPRDPEIARLAKQLAPPGSSAQATIKTLLSWIDENIKKEAADVFTARDVLDLKRAECQGHAYVYVSLARAAGIPTRVVNGLAYSEDHQGFLYHTWAESVVDGRWRAVDPTFGQPEADATHIALIEGEELADLIPLTEWVGNTRIEIVPSR